MTLLADVVDTAATVAATSRRNAKRDAIAALLARLEPAEVVPVVGFLVGRARQGRIGVGWATVRDLADHPAGAAAPTLTVADLDTALDRLVTMTGEGSQALRRHHLHALFAAATPAEADFVGRLLLGEMRTGALAGVLTDAVATAAGIAPAAVRRAAMLTGDLGTVAADVLAGGADAAAAVGLRPLRAVQPMLAATSATVADAIGALGEASVEWKLDGARIQVHRAGDEIRVYTRNLNDVTDRVAEVVDVAAALDADTFVLDGEVLGTDLDDSPRAFQDTMRRFGRTGADQAGTDRTEATLALVPRFFDLLHLDGRDLIDEPLRHRRAALVGLAGAHVVPGRITADPAEAQAVLDEALGHGHEGVMVKAADSPYEAGRRGRTWRKVKPVHTLDLVVLGVEWGSGRRRGWLSNLHLGALDAPGGVPVMVGKTFKGLTDATLAWQTQRFLELETHRDGPVVRVRPVQVVEIALDGAQVSTRYPGGVALRFARVVRYRPDKDAADADTLDAVRALLPPVARSAPAAPATGGGAGS